MQWEKAKNLMIVFFLAANILLAAVNRNEAVSYQLTREREAAIQTVFHNNDITLYHPIPVQFSPMRALLLSGQDYDIERLKKIFFPLYAAPEHIQDVMRDVFIWEDMRLTISGDYVFFVSGLGITGVPDLDAAIKLTQDFIDAYYPEFIIDIQSTRQARRGGLRIFYRQVYQNKIIHTNYIEFLITGEADDVVIEEVDIRYNRPIGPAYMPRELVGPDEALLTFMQYIRSRSYEPILIRYMDIVYLQQPAGLRENNITLYSYAEPFYRIFIEGLDEPFLINAYTNRML